MSKVVLVTGGSSGLGEAICLHLSSKGYKVYGTSRKPSSTTSYPFALIAMDVCDKNSVQQAVSSILSKEGKIDVVINNAGLGMAAPLEESNSAEIDTLFTTNIKGVIHVIQSVLPSMRTQKKGLIINITSIAAMVALPYRGLYCASKAAVEKITDATRMEVKDFGIQLCSFQAGDIKTNINANRLTAEVGHTSPYFTNFTRINRSIHEDVDNAVEPEYYAKEIEKIILKSKVKRSYASGKFVQKLSRNLSKVLPGTWFEKIILNHYKL